VPLAVLLGQAKPGCAPTVAGMDLVHRTVQSPVHTSPVCGPRRTDTITHGDSSGYWCCCWHPSFQLPHLSSSRVGPTPTPTCHFRQGGFATADVALLSNEAEAQSALE
jgi:hypothetical protein